MNQARLNRFEAKNPMILTLSIQGKGDLELSISNVSLMGIGATYRGYLPETLGLKQGDIIDRATFHDGKESFDLGRVLLARHKGYATSDQAPIGIALLDQRLPTTIQVQRSLEFGLGDNFFSYESIEENKVEMPLEQLAS